MRLMSVFALIVEVDVVWWAKAIGLSLLGFVAGAIATIWLIFKDWKIW